MRWSAQSIATGCLIKSADDLPIEDVMKIEDQEGLSMNLRINYMLVIFDLLLIVRLT